MRTVPPAVAGSRNAVALAMPFIKTPLSGGGGCTRSACSALCESRGRVMGEVVPEREAEQTAERKPIGGNEADFEAVLIDGILGFSLSFGNAILLLVGAVTHAGSFFDSALITVIAALVSAAFFKIVQLKTDAISRRLPRVAFVCCHAACFLVAIVGMCLGLQYLIAVAAALGLADTLILYGRFLAALARKALMLVVDAAFLYPGIMLMVIVNVPWPYDTVILSAMVLVTIVVALLFIRRNYDFGELISAADSKARSIKVKGNVHTLFLVGFMISAFLLFNSLPFTMEISNTALGLAFALAGIGSLLMRQINERGTKDALRKTMGLVSLVLLLPLMLVPGEIQLVLLACYSCYVVLETLTILDAIVETVRFNLIAAMWLIGKECSVFFGGIAAGGAIFALFPWITRVLGPEYAMLILCIVVAAFCAWLQIKVNYQVYPYEPIIEEEVDEEVTARIERNGRRKDLWHQKIDAACEQYRLSPREREILPILLRGRDAKYIMDTFYISQSTAKTHIYNIYRKFGIHSRQELLDFVEDIEFMEFEMPDEAEHSDDSAQ